MDQADLIDAIVRRIADLVVDLALSVDTPPRIGHLPDLLFRSLDHRIREGHGKPQTVAADLLGLRLRTYQHRLKSVRDPERDRRGATLWGKVYGYIHEKTRVSHAEIDQHFHLEAEEQLKSILKQMIEASLIFRTGRSPAYVYRINDSQSLDPGDDRFDTHLVWVALYASPGLTADGLARHLAVAPGHRARLDVALERLVHDGSIEADESQTPPTYRAQAYTFASDARDARWAGMYDHISVMIDALTDRLAQSRGTLEIGGPVGGATYRFDLPLGSLRTDEARDLLDRMRLRCTELRESLDAEVAAGAPSTGRVVFYFGQTHRPPLDSADEPSERAGEDPP